MKKKVFKACLAIIEKEGWTQFTFAKAAHESGISLSVFHKYYTKPADVMISLFQEIDSHVLKQFELSTETLPPKEALFDILMTRFDVALPYKEVIKSYWQDWNLSPNDVPSLACQGFSSMSWMLEAAGLSARGLTGFLRVQGLMALYVLTLRTWFTDESPDLGKTMAFLDKGLSKMEKAATLLQIF